MLAKFKNSALTTISSSIDNTQTSVAVTDSSVFPSFNSANGEYFLAIITDSITNYEIVKVIAISGNTLTVIRGFESTTAKSFLSGARIINKLTAGFLNGIESGGGGPTYTSGTGINITGNTISLAGSVVGPGTYNSVSVDQYGRVIFGSSENYDYSAGSGISINSRTVSLSGTAVTPGTYNNVTVDQYGRVTAGTNSSGGGGSVDIQNDDSTYSTFYPTFSSVSSGTLSTANVSSSKLQFNPSTGNLLSVIFTSLSDINSKTNIESLDFEYCMNVITRLNPVSFNWKDNGLKSYGLIAQEVENVLPEVVHESEDNVKTINYSALIPFLLTIIQYLIKRI